MSYFFPAIHSPTGFECFPKSAPVALNILSCLHEKVIFFTFASAILAFQALNPTPIGFSSTLTAMPAAKSAMKPAKSAMKPTKVAMKAMKVSNGTKKATTDQKKNHGKTTMKKIQDQKAMGAMKKGGQGSKPAPKLKPKYVGYHLAIKCTKAKCPSWIWVAKSFSMEKCAMCSTPWWKSFHQEGVHLRQWEPGTIQAFFQGVVKKDAAPALWPLVFHVQPQWLWMFVSVYSHHV